MSRCFPFPPPGYEKEARRYDLDLLKKEKDKERKLKKEKKNREKREGKDKDKKEKDRSDGKHRDKKEKKEKHRDKKKDKDKSSTSDEKRLLGQTEHINGDKASDEKKLLGKSEVNSGEVFVQKGNERDFVRNSISGENKLSGQFSGYSERVSQNSYFTKPQKDSKLVQQVDRRIGDEAGGAGKQYVEKLTGADARKDEGMVRLVTKSTDPSADGKEKNKRGDDKKLDGQGIKDGPRFTGNAMAQSVPGIVQPRIDRTSKPLEKDGDTRIEGKEKRKQKEGDDRHRDKRKDKDKEKEGRGKEKNRDKEKKKEEKAKENSEHRKTEPNKLKESGKDGLTVIYNAKTSQLPEESIKNLVTEGNLKKRKDSDTNGFLSAYDIKPNKVSKTAPSYPLTQNGKTLGTTQNSSPVISGKQGAVNNLKADAKENKINGITEAPAVSISSTVLPPSIPAKPLLTAAMADQIVEPSRKLPHPDLKYLSEVFTVPEVDEWSDFDDREWLFQGSDSQSKKPKVGASGNDETLQVWSEALRIDSADVCALPYVIPF